MPSLKQRLEEIHRRSLWQVTSVYLAGGWFVLEVIQTLQEELLLPGWVFRAGIVLLLIGLPIILTTTYVQRGLKSRDGGGDEIGAREDGPEGAVAGAARGAAGGLFTWRNALAGGVLAFALLGVATVVRVFLIGAPGLAADDEGPAAIAVLPFTVRGAPELDVYRDGVADWLSRSLSVLDDVRVVDVGSVLKAVEDGPGPGLLDAPTAAAVAREVGADYYVVGGLTGGGERLQMYASLYDADAPDRAIAEADVEGTADEIMSVVGRMSAELILPHLGSGSARAVRSAARATASPGALRAFLSAEQALRVSRYPEAIADLQLATAEDSGFALAYLRMSIAAALMETDGGYVSMIGMVPDALPRALALEERLGPRDRRLLQSYAAFRRGEADEAEAGFRALLRSNPNDTEARFFLAQVLYRLNPPRGRSFYEAREEFDRVLEDDPGFTCPL